MPVVPVAGAFRLSGQPSLAGDKPPALQLVPQNVRDSALALRKEIGT